MDGLSNEKKINRRRTRNRTQVIHFDLSELETLRESPTPEIPSTPNLAQLSLNSFLLNNYAHENEEQSQGIRSNRNLNKEIVVQNINQENDNQKINPEPVVNIEQVSNLEEITNIITFGDQMINNQPLFSSSEVVRFDTQRMFNFSEITNFFKKLEKRELFPKSKHDYAYKKSKGGETNNNNLLEERNLIQMRIEEEVIPCLNNNPFIQYDKKVRK